MIVSIVANIVNVAGNALSLYGWFGLPVLGRLPFDPKLASLCDEGRIEDCDSGLLKGAADLIEQV